MSTEAPETPALNFMDLRANVTTGVWDQVRLAAKFITTRVAGAARETFIELPKAVWAAGDDPMAHDPAVYHLERYKRGADRLREIGSWAVEQEMVAPGAKAPLPHYQRPF